MTKAETRKGVKKMNNLIQKAILMAMKAHQGEVRKGDGKTPYIVHPLEVGITFSYYSTNDEASIACAILHDILENGKENYEAIKVEFGEEIANIVQALTEDKSIKDWVERKNENINRLRNFKINNFRIAYHLKVIDSLVNMKELLFSIKSQGQEVWQKFNAPKEQKMQYFEVILNDLRQELPNVLLEKYVATLKDLEYAHLLVAKNEEIGFNA